MHPFTTPLRERIIGDLIWYTRYFFRCILPMLFDALSYLLLIILLPILAAFVV